MNQFLEVAVDAAREAGALLLDRIRSPKKITYKGEVDIVTESDRRSEAIVVGSLRRHFPQHEIVAEEGSGGSYGKRALSLARRSAGRHHKFRSRISLLCVSIGLLEDGEPIVGVVFNPVSDEMFTAMRGEGAYLNQKRIHVSPIDTLATSLLCHRISARSAHQQTNIAYYAGYTLRSHGVRRDGSAALDLCGVALDVSRLFGNLD